MELDLLLDIGNTRSKWITTKSMMEDSLAIEHSGVINNQELADQIREQFAFLTSTNLVLEINNIYCTCVGHLELLKVWQDQFPRANFFQLTGGMTIPEFNNGYDRPTELGTDRLAGMFGAKKLHPHKNSLIIASGTATTIDYLHEGTTFIGGWILPGLDLMLKSLGKSTANLPSFEASQIASVKSDEQKASKISMVPFATSTKEAIEMGVVSATIGAIQQAISQLEHLDLVIFTGGNAHLLEPYLQLHTKGVICIQEKNLILIGINAWRLHHKEVNL